MIVVDASVLVSALWPDDANHGISRAWLEAYGLSNETMAAPVARGLKRGVLRLLVLPRTGGRINFSTGRGLSQVAGAC